MPSFPGTVYAPPGVYTETKSDNPVASPSAGVRVPVLVGTGSELLTQQNLEIVRGSSVIADTEVVGEDQTARAVVSVTAAGVVTLGAFNGSRTRFRVLNYPIVTGDGTATVASDRSHVTVTVNSKEVVVLTVTGSTGIIELAVAPAASDLVRCSYFFDRADTGQTDTVSAQVTSSSAVLTADTSGSYVFSAADENNEFKLTVDREAEKTYTVPDGTYTAQQLANFINTSAPGTLAASAVANQQGGTALRLTADESLVIGTGTANTVLGLTGGAATARNRVFRTFNGPIVTGLGGGVTTTSVSDVTVTVDGTAVTPESVDGANRAVTLAYPPAPGSAVKITYFWNTWQDTFDYLRHPDVQTVTAAGEAPGLSSYVNGTDFVLSNDRIVWGTAALVSSGTSAGTIEFGTSQVTATLVDQKGYLEPCTAVVDTSVNPPAVSRTTFQLPFQPTTGNGRDTPLGTSLFQSVSNSRIDLPTNRPDLVVAYWGFGPQDALDRGAVTVLSVESSDSSFELSSPVPAGAQVYATFYYNLLVDGTYTLNVLSAGPSGTGTYGVQDSDGTELYAAVFGTKGSALSNVTVVTPSGAERTIDARLEPHGGSSYTGPVEETVTVRFETRDATPARYTVPSAAPYEFVRNASDRLLVTLDGTDADANGVDLSSPTGVGGGFFASLVGSEIAYEASGGYDTFTTDASNDTISLNLDGVSISAKAEHSASATAATYVSALNRNAKGDASATSGAGNVGGTTVVLAASSSAHTDYYVGWEITLTSGVASGETKTVSAYDGGTKTATVSVAFSAQVANGVSYIVSNPATRPQYVAATKFNASTVIANAEHDKLVLRYVGAKTSDGTVNDSTDLTAQVAAATYATAADLATAVQSTVDTQLALLGATFDGLAITVSANGSGQLVFKLRRAQADASGYLEFVPHGTPAEDFAMLAGIDTAADNAGQIKLVDGDIARRYTVAGGAGALLLDRIVLRNRLLPGSGSLKAEHAVAQSKLLVVGSTGAALAGLTVGAELAAGYRAAVLPATQVGYVNLGGGQSTAANAGKGLPAVTFYSTSTTKPKNNVFRVTVDGTSYVTTFTAGVGTLTPLGPSSVASSVIGQIVAQNAALSGLVSLEGGAIRISSALNTSLSFVVIGDGSANAALGFTEGASASRTLVGAPAVASALMSHLHASINETVNKWAVPTGTYFAGLGLAFTVEDEVDAEYLHIQSRTAGSASSVTLSDAPADNALAHGTGIGAEDGDGAVGEAGVSGFYVKSSDPDGSGSVNTSVLNTADDGTGQDGIVGQTYRDEVTGLTFTVLPRDGGLLYPTGANATFTLVVGKTVTANANVAVKVVPGVELLVSNTVGAGVEDTALVETHERGGLEPEIGQPYYVSYTYLKSDYDVRVLQSLADVEAEYGVVAPENPLSLAAYFAFLNGATAVAFKQVPKTNGVASEAAFRTAIDELEGQLEGGLKVDIICPLLSGSKEFYQYVARHCEIQSSLRYQAERTAVCGFGAGVVPKTAGEYAQAVKSQLLRFVYPDMVKATIRDSLNRSKQYLLDGYYAAAALVGVIVAPSHDVATPWTGRTLRGFDGLVRVLNNVDANSVAQKGVTVLEDRPPLIRVRHGLTTDTTSNHTKIPTVAQIQHEIHKRIREVLDRYVGVKYLPGILGQIEGQVSKVLRDAVQEQIIVGYTGVSATMDAEDPTVVNIQAFYAPVFPLLYLRVTLNMRSSLT